MPENQDPPLVDVKVTNPITFIKKWWAKIIGNEGVELRLRVRPLTAIAISVIAFSLAFGLGGIILPFDSIFTKPKEVSPTPAPEEWRDTAFTGTLRFTTSTQKYFLVTSSSEAITLNVPDNVDLSDLIGRRIFASGKYNKGTRTLVVDEATGLEVLPTKIVPVPTTTPTPAPTAPPEPTPTPSETQTPTP